MTPCSTPSSLLGAPNSRVSAGLLKRDRWPLLPTKTKGKHNLQGNAQVHHVTIPVWVGTFYSRNQGSQRVEDSSARRTSPVPEHFLVWLVCLARRPVRTCRAGPAGGAQFDRVGGLSGPRRMANPKTTGAEGTFFLGGFKGNPKEKALFVGFFYFDT